MAYTPNPDREVKDGKAMVSAKELADFKSQYGEDKTLRDLLNADKGLRRKGEDSGSSKSSTRAARPTSTETRSAPEPRESAVAASNDQTSSAPSSDSSSSSKSWWTTPNKNLQEGTFPSGKEIRSALGSSYKKGGSVSSRADGIAQRGKTRGKMC
jgi:hypothetical protein